MARIFITGSADGLGLMAAQKLTKQGHQVFIHARNTQRGKDALKRVSGAEKVLIADLANLDDIRSLADQVNEAGNMDAVIHNAGVYQTTSKHILTVNTLAPYMLTALIQKPKRLVYLSSGMHSGGKVNLATLKEGVNYSDSKLLIVMLAFAVAKKWPDVFSNAVNPGWVATKMGGQHAPDDLQKGFETQCWLAGSNDPNAKVSGRYFFHQKEQKHNPLADDKDLQDNVLAELADITGVELT